jgi:WD40 repeat protein
MHRLHLLFLIAAAALAVQPQPARAAGPDKDPTPTPKLLGKLPGSSGTSASFSSDGKRILTAGAGEARVWDAQTLRPVTEPLRHGDFVRLAAFSPDATKLLTAGDNEVRVWNAATGRRLCVLPHRY